MHVQSVLRVCSRVRLTPTRAVCYESSSHTTDASSRLRLDCGRLSGGICPVLAPVCYVLVLFRARRAIIRRTPSRLSRACTRSMRQRCADGGSQSASCSLAHVVCAAMLSTTSKRRSCASSSRLRFINRIVSTLCCSQYFYWEAVDLVRRIVLTGGLLIIPDSAINIRVIVALLTRASFGSFSSFARTHASVLSSTCFPSSRHLFMSVSTWGLCS